MIHGDFNGVANQYNGTVYKPVHYHARVSSISSSEQADLTAYLGCTIPAPQGQLE
jgi:hypothetical protein